jgi:hypothetical protein
MKLNKLLKASLLVSGTIALVPKKDLKPDVFVCTDISNEPDDAESLVRLLLYTNEVNVKGIVATTSYWLNNTIHDEDIYPILDAYEQVHPNLLKHSPYYPTADYFRSIVTIGHPVYGLAALDLELSPGAKNLITAVDEVEETLFVLLWGGANVLAEALNEIKKSRTEEEINEFISKVIVYSISDQDNSGPWIRYNFPKLKYIASIHSFNDYGHSAWVGMSGEIFNEFDFGGPDSSLVTKEWAKKNIQSVGPLGKAYLTFAFLMEGDTPSTLYVVPNGLGHPNHPEFGSWGGRYKLSDLHGDFQHYGDALDHVIGQDGRQHVSNKATIWRWREAYQNDFAARIQWTVKDFKEAAHQPVVVTNGKESVLPEYVTVNPGTEITLDVSESYDLNGKKLSVKWSYYKELTLTQGNPIELKDIAFNSQNDESTIVKLTVPSFKESCFNLFGRPLDKCKSFHIIAEVSNDATPRLFGYKRFILQVEPGPNDNFADVKETVDVEEAIRQIHDEL